MKELGVEAQDEEREQRLLRVQAVLGLVPHDALGAVDDLCGLLLAAHGREAVHEDGVLGRQVHGLAGHLEGHEGLEALGAVRGGDAVAHPRVAVHDVGVLDGGITVMADLEGPAGGLLKHGLALLHHGPLHLEILGVRSSDVDVEAHEASKPHQVIGHVILAVADERKLHTREVGSLADLGNGEKVRQHLARMGKIIQGVHNRNGGI
mmetsp:Transcript_51921/g.135508  ORF Transcript_51921/g.135508 Transcript_51921/m.135508 type:complete len:207 (+) Transcript_51921:538-1158(+)